MRICELAYAEMTEAMNRGWAGRDLRGDDAGRERAGIEVKVDPERLKESLALPFPVRRRRRSSGQQWLQCPISPRALRRRGTAGSTITTGSAPWR
jgi:hypothetical protein